MSQHTQKSTANKESEQLSTLASRNGSPSLDNDEWFCTKCRTVFISKTGKCCGEVEPFNIEKHGRSLISSSNSWYQVWNKWKNHPIIEKVATEWAEHGNYGAAGILNDAFGRMANVYV